MENLGIYKTSQQFMLSQQLMNSYIAANNNS